MTPKKGNCHRPPMTVPFLLLQPRLKELNFGPDSRALGTKHVRGYKAIQGGLNMCTHVRSRVRAYGYLGCSSNGWLPMAAHRGEENLPSHGTL